MKENSCTYCHLTLGEHPSFTGGPKTTTGYITLKGNPKGGHQEHSRSGWWSPDSVLVSQQLYDHHGERYEHWLGAGKGERTRMRSQLPHGDLGWVTGSHRQMESWLVPCTVERKKAQMTNTWMDQFNFLVLLPNSPVTFEMGKHDWTLQEHVMLHTAYHFTVSKTPTLKRKRRKAAEEEVKWTVWYLHHPSPGPSCWWTPCPPGTVPPWTSLQTSSAHTCWRGQGMWLHGPSGPLRKGSLWTPRAGSWSPEQQQRMWKKTNSQQSRKQLTNYHAQSILHRTRGDTSNLVSYLSKSIKSNNWQQQDCRSTTSSVAHFLSTLQDKVSWRPNFNRTVSWWCKNDRSPDLQKIKSLVVNRMRKVEVHITDNHSWNSCCKVASDHEFTFGAVMTKKKHNALWSCTIHDHIPRQNMVPLPSGCAGQHVCLLCWTQAWVLLGNNSRLVRSTIKKMGNKTTRTVF